MTKLSRLDHPTHRSNPSIDCIQSTCGGVTILIIFLKIFVKVNLDRILDNLYIF